MPLLSYIRKKKLDNGKIVTLVWIMNIVDTNSMDIVNNAILNG